MIQICLIFTVFFLLFDFLSKSCCSINSVCCFSFEHNVPKGLQCPGFRILFFSTPAGQPCFAPHRSAANGQDPWGEAPTGTAVARHTPQPAEPLFATVRRGGGSGRLQQPPRGHPAAQLQQGKQAQQCEAAHQHQNKRFIYSSCYDAVKPVSRLFLWWDFIRVRVSLDTGNTKCCDQTWAAVTLRTPVCSSRHSSSEQQRHGRTRGPCGPMTCLPVGVLHPLPKKASDKLQQDAPVVHEGCCTGDWSCNPFSPISAPGHHFVPRSHAS